ncbi:MAG: ABC transporter permease, partial [Nocardioides sp.]|nr:ABC transporter permease [Nocardioides sp.]
MSDALLRPSDDSTAMRLLKGILRSRELAVAAVLVLLVVITTLNNNSFLFGATGWRDLLLTPSMLVLLAVGQTAVIITRNVDLSVGSTMGLTAYLTGRLFIDQPGLPIIVVVLCGVLMGAALG